jgi:hypothetical protein
MVKWDGEGFVMCQGMDRETTGGSRSDGQRGRQGRRGGMMGGGVGRGGGAGTEGRRTEGPDEEKGGKGVVRE